MSYTLYMHIAPNNKKYIGITKREPTLRWKNGNAYKNSEHFANAIKKYGWENIEHIILFTDLTKEQAEQKEIEMIAKYKSNQRNFGYNIANGGHCIESVSEEIRLKISKALTGRKATSPKSDETREKNRRSMLKVWANKECRKRITEGIIRGHGMKVVCVETGKVFMTAVEAGNYYKICRAHIGACCRGERKTAGGYHWARYDGGNI